jgi:hypothetical protein
MSGPICKGGDVPPRTVWQVFTVRDAAPLQPALRDEPRRVGAPNVRVGVQAREWDDEALWAG